jgi:hypothetical protein
MKKIKQNKKYFDKMVEMFTQKWAERMAMQSYHIPANTALFRVRLTQSIRFLGWIGGLTAVVLSLYLVLQGYNPETSVLAGLILAACIVRAAYYVSPVPANTAQLAHDWKKALPSVKYVLRHSLVYRSEPSSELVASRINVILIRLADRIQLMEKEGDHRSEKLRTSFGRFYDMAKDLGLEPDSYGVYLNTLDGGLQGQVRVPEAKPRTVRILLSEN